MSLKTSLFNKSVIKSDFKRFWWVSALNTLALLVCFTFIYVYNEIVHHPGIIENLNYTRSDLYQTGQFATVFSLIFPVVLCVLIFSYLNSSKSVACLHGMPIKRSTFFWSHALSATTMIILPVVINTAVLLLFRLHPSVAEGYFISHLFIWSGQYILYSLLAFSITSAVMMITGNSVAGVIITYILGILPLFEEIFINFFCDQQLYGYSYESGEMLTKFLYVLPEEMYSHPINVLKYVLFIVVFLSAALLLYKHRKLENNGEVVAFPKLRYVFIYGVAVCAGAAGYAYLSAITNKSAIWMLVPFGVIGLVIAQMIVKKSFKIKTVYKPIIIFCIAVGIVQLGFNFDIFGYERRLPEPDEIASVDFECDVSRYNGYYSGYRVDGKKIVFDDSEDIITNPDTIEKLCNLHKNLIEVRPDKISDGNGIWMTFTYNLKNGREISREYVVDYDEHGDTLKPLVETNDIRKIYFPVLRDTEREILSLNITDTRIDKTGKTYHEEDGEIIERFIGALKADTSKTAYDEFVHRTPEYTRINISSKYIGKFEDGTDVPFEYLPTVEHTYYVRSDYTSTLALLDEIGFYDALPTAEDIEKIGVEFHDKDVLTEPMKLYNTESASSYPADSTNITCDKIITDREDINKIYAYFGNEFIPYDGYNATLYVVLKDERMFNIDFNTEDVNIPKVLKFK